MALSLLTIVIIVFAAVTVHYGVLWLLKTCIIEIHNHHHTKVLSGIFGTLIAHTIEIVLFAIGYYFMADIEGLGYLSGNFNGEFIDYIYFSYTSYTTLGFGDIEPHGYIRLLVGVEALIGLVLITWTASFLFLQLQNGWTKKK